MRLSAREQQILKFLERGPLAILELSERLIAKGFEISKITLNRDLSSLIEKSLIEREGEGKSTVYKLSSSYKLLRPIDFAEYFSVDADDRIIEEQFNYKLFDTLQEIFIEEELFELDELNKNYQSRIKTYPKDLFKKELERLMIELSWKSSRMEGNTYDLLETENLIKEKVESKGHSKEEATMILNHKKALDFVFENKKLFKQITVKQIQKIHALLVKDLKINIGFREKKIGIIGTKYKPLGTKAEISKAYRKLCKLINQQKNPLTKALTALALISYIQGFADGNKRTARIVSTAILLANNYCPISYRSVNEFDYKKSLILFHEQNNIVYLKKLFIQQFKFSTEEYFG